MTQIRKLTLAQARQALENKEFSCVELTQAHLDAMRDQRQLNAYVAETPESALEAARESDVRYAKGTPRALEGIPLGIKDLFATKGVHTQACSNILKGFKPPYESTVTQNLLDNGAVFLGKLNMDEFAMGSANITSCYGPVLNPHRGTEDKDLVPGGSSGGSAAAVAANLCLGATGTDTGGSIRQPAAFCGITGIKPTYGRCSRWGIVAFASSLDQAGPMAKTVEDCALMLNAMAGYDPKDSTSMPGKTPDFTTELGQSIKGLTIGIPKEYESDGTDPAINKYWQDAQQMMKDAGANIVSVSLPHTSYALPTYYIIAPAEASSNLARYDGVKYGLRVMDEGDSLIDMYKKTRSAGFGEEVKRRILIGSYVLSAGYYDAYYKKAQKIRRLIAKDFHKAFQKCDALLTPATPTVAFGLHEKQDDPIKMYLNDVFTVPTSLAGLPGLVLPVGYDQKHLPVGMQLIGRAFQEVSLFRVASILQSATAFQRFDG